VAGAQLLVMFLSMAWKALFIASLLLAAPVCLLAKEENSINGSEGQKAQEYTNSSYGVDCSFPIHKYDLRKYGTCGDLLADRASFYKEFIKGCRDLFAYRCALTERDRIEQLLRQPRSMRNYTATGYKHLRTPTELLNVIQQHWERSKIHNKDNPDYIETWGKGLTYVNYWKQNTTYYGILDDSLGGSTELHDKILSLVQPIVEDWTQMELRATSLYGIRVYREGAILTPHVDRFPLISSAIINVAQGGLTEDWPLEVYGMHACMSACLW
jgi:prolyl 4-hydroxylase